MATANPNLGAVRGYAGGGLISKLFGKSETVTEKFARQDAEFRAKHPERTATPAPAAPGIGGIKGMISGSLKTNLQEREKAAGLKAGGMVKKCVTGGKISGPGGPTDDLVPIMASNGEFMIKASSAKVLGPKVLKALNDVGGKGVEREPGKMAGGGEVDQLAMSNRLIQQRNLQDATAQGLAAIPQDSQKTYAPEIGPSQIEMPQLKAGGMVRKMVVPHMAEAGSVDEARRRAEQLAKIPTGGRTAPAPDGLSNGNDFTRNVNNSLNALGGMGVVASVPLKAAQAGQGAIRTAMNAAPVLQNGIPRLAAPIAKAAQAAPDFVAGASGVQRVGGANLPAVVQNAGIPIAKTTNVALQEGAKANQMAAGTRSLGNASAGAGMLDQQQAPLEQVPPVAPSAPSLNAPWYSPEYAKAANMSDLNGLELERARRAAGSPGDANDPLKSLILNGTVGASSPATAQAKPATAATSTQPTLPANTRGQGYTDPRQAGVSQPSAAPTDEFSNAAIAQRNPGGMVRKVVGADGRTTYSGSNISGDVSFQGADGNALPGRPGGGSMTYGGMISAQNNQAAENLARAGGQTRGFGPSGAIRGGGQVSSMDTSAGYAADLKQLAEIQAGKDQQNANMQAQADYAQNQVLQQKALQGNPAALALLKGQMTDQTTRRGQDLNAGAMRQTNQLAQDKFGLESQGVNMDNQQKFQMLQIQKAMFDPKATPEQRAEATKQFMALNGKTQASQYDFAPGGQAVIDGQLVTQPGVIFNKATGDAKTPGAQQQKANATSKADYDKLPAGSVYTGQDGKQYKKG